MNQSVYFHASTSDSETDSEGQDEIHPIHDDFDHSSLPSLKSTRAALRAELLDPSVSSPLSHTCV